MNICLRLVGRLDGSWMAVKPGSVPASVWADGVHIPLVPTGDIDWHNNTPAEIYVPADRLAEWRAEHACS